MTVLQIADRVLDMTPSPTSSLSARTAELRAAGQDIIGMGTGELDFDTPGHIKAAAKAAMDRGLTKYTAVDGVPELKQAIIAKLARENGLRYELPQVMASCGCKQTLYNLVQATINQGDEVIIPGPYWVSYPDIVRLAGGVPVVVSAGIEQGFKIFPDQLARVITEKTRLIFMNSPSNPTGAYYSPEELAGLADVLLKHERIVVASDDIYEHMLWEGGPFKNMINVCPDLYDRTFVLNGVSKAYAMTGWRIGFAAGPQQVIQKMKTIQSQSTSNPTSISQYAAIAALGGDQSFTREVVKILKERHDYVFGALSKMSGVRSRPSQGTFYQFADVREAMAGMGIEDDVQFSEYLIDNARVAVVPGSAFGAPGHIRLSFATSMDNLEKAMERIGSALK